MFIRVRSQGIVVRLGGSRIGSQRPLPSRIVSHMSCAAGQLVGSQLAEEVRGCDAAVHQEVASRDESSI